MYSDRAEEVGKRSVKDRLNGNVVDDAVRRRTVTGKRQRQDDKWEHDLFEDEPQPSRSKVSRLDARDLRLKLQKRSTQQGLQSGGVRDLREKLSGSMHSQPLNVNPQNSKPIPEASKPTRRSVLSEPPIKVSSAIVKKTQRKADASVDGFLQSLGLEKYRIQFQAEEVDMTALEHMTDEDLKAMGIPMGPRKKILSALPSRT